MDTTAQLETIKINNFNRKLKNELDYWKDGGNINMFSNPEIDVTKRIELLETLLNVPTKQQETIQQQKDNIFKEIDKYTYKKQWNKLLPFHQITKIKEYINENIKDETMKNELIEKLSTYSEEKRINTKKHIVYDPNIGKILLMPCLTVDIDKKTYSLKVV
ncbi:hypothetical protein QKU48_gp0324 [Fadolivirus algeromassiliense]|jgi:hypothetical protein|uniref:Uncharacterized protein n=1 Tax=Fadolivirus FV1/VV64 TaxID=3070911 RepID=A0A7D3R0J7_9VIRU|nr:hypothetical protein QKU48_gp0324 [Fadolivirus algeromassiliense]QKF93782.1 hypothetical protein Fadolivirus_1_324 [Fadolivirus FV1/VV64]